MGVKFALTRIRHFPMLVDMPNCEEVLRVLGDARGRHGILSRLRLPPSSTRIGCHGVPSTIGYSRSSEAFESLEPFHGIAKVPNTAA